MIYTFAFAFNQCTNSKSIRNFVLRVSVFTEIDIVKFTDEASLHQNTRREMKLFCKFVVIYHRLQHNEKF